MIHEESLVCVLCAMVMMSGQGVVDLSSDDHAEGIILSVEVERKMTCTAADRCSPHSTTTHSSR